MRISYLLKKTFEGIFQRGRANLILVVCLALSFLVLDAFIVITVNLWGLSQRLKRDIEIEVFLQDDIDPEQIRSLQEDLLNLTEVEKVIYRSRGEAFTEMEDYLGEKALRGLDSSTFPASFQVDAKKDYKNFQQISPLALRIGNKEGVEEVEFGGEWLSKLDRAVRIFLSGDIIFGILVTLSVILMVSNFMRVAILSQAESIQVMNLLGASWKDLYLPLLWQGMIFGGLGALLGISLIWTVYKLLFVKLIDLTFLPFHLIAGSIIWGMILGGGGCFWTIKRQGANFSLF